MFVVQSTGDIPVCPLCGGKLAYRDSRKRIYKGEGGLTAHIIIRRLRCTECNAIHNELPDCLIPHKHYATEVISGVLDGMITPDDDDSEDYPCQETMQRWINWFQTLLTTTNSTELHLDELRRKYPNWLERLVGDAPGLFCQKADQEV